MIRTGLAVVVLLLVVLGLRRAEPPAVPAPRLRLHWLWETPTPLPGVCVPAEGLRA